MLCAQTEKELKTIELYSGQNIYGAILFESADVLVIESIDGVKFQYQKTEIKAIRSLSETELNTQIESNSMQKETQMGLLLFAKGGVCYLPQKGLGASSDINLIIGHKNVANRGVFAGIGVGYSVVYVPDNTIGFIPVFMHVEMNWHKTGFSPTLAFDAGYGFCTTNSMQGGLRAEVSFNGKYNITAKTAFIIGAFAGVQQVWLEQSEIINNEAFAYKGNSALVGVGLRVGFMF